MKAHRPSISFWWSCWSCLLWLPSLFIFGAFRRGFKGIRQAAMFTPAHKSFLSRLIKRFNFKLPNYVPPLEVAQEREQEPFMTETPSPRPAPPFPRTPSSPSPPPEVVPTNIPSLHPLPQYVSSPTFFGPLVDNSARTVYTPTKRNYSQVIHLTLIFCQSFNCKQANQMT